MSSNTILTVGGAYFDFDRPDFSGIDIRDIAHSLANLCRFTGHTKHFYSVAQHSVLVSYQVPPQHALAGLMHDAAEAFIGDVSSPLKRLLADYRAIEDRVEAALFAHFCLPEKLPPCVKQADLLLLNTERRDLMHSNSRSQAWAELNGLGILAQPIVPQSSAVAYQKFVDRYCEILLWQCKA